ncbi:MAG: YHS domain-containing protein [Gammaproteobacteria bacterium]|jgi:YHS domain-containing protein
MTKYFLPTAALSLLCTCNAFAGSRNTNDKNVVLHGHDVVSYHTQDKAIQGTASYSATYDGVEFHFASADNRDMFVKAPAKYAPKYNAYCAFAAAHHNAKVPANADTFKLYNGKLLVFFNDLNEGEKFNTKIPWNGNEQAFYATANENWKTLEAK